MQSIPARLFIVLIATLAAGCQRNGPASEEGRSAGAADPKVSYPAPRWPSYFKQPESIEQLMPAARSLVRNKSGFLGVGMGVLQEGETVLLVPSSALRRQGRRRDRQGARGARRQEPRPLHLRDARQDPRAGRAGDGQPAQGPAHRRRRHLPGVAVDHRPVPRPRPSRRSGSRSAARISMRSSSRPSPAPAQAPRPRTRRASR